MFGIRFMKALPNTYLIQYKKGRIVREGTGISFFYYGPTTSLIAVPMASIDVPFILNEVTADFQDITIQGQIAYRVKEPRTLAQIMNFTLAQNAKDYVSDDPKKIWQRVINQIQVLMRAELQKLTIRQALQSSDELVRKVRQNLVDSEFVTQLGIEVMALSVLAVKPNPETARALEAKIREQMLLEADEAIYRRRNAAVEQERTIKENELSTEIAVENKKRQIREAQVDADRAIQEKRQLILQDEMNGKITLEEKNKELVSLAVQNKKQEADAQAYRMTAVMQAFKDVDPKVMQTLANVGMQPAHLIASAFQSLAENAGKIGNLNIAPELLQELLKAAPIK